MHPTGLPSSPSLSRSAPYDPRSLHPARPGTSSPQKLPEGSVFDDTGATIRLPALLAQLVEHLHGKEGVDGSSPSEGLQRRRLWRGSQPNVQSWVMFFR